jgi:hypothetical protein
MIRKSTRAILAAICFGVWAGSAAAQPITRGDIVVVRFGDGTAALGAFATPVFLDEYTPTGTLVRSIAVPSAGTSALTVTGNATTEGILSLSQNGGLLVFAGYRKDAGAATATGANDTPATTNRVIGTLTPGGVVNTSIAITDGTAANFRSATTVNGSSYYTSTSAQVGYVASPGPASTTAAIDARNSRQVNLAGNVLYASNGSTTITDKVQSYGTLPTGAATPSPVVTLALADAVNGFFLADLNSAVAGIDTVYALSTVEGLLRKFTFNGTSWAANGSITAAAAQDLTGVVNGTTVQLYITSPASLFAFTDASGIGGTLTGALGAPLVNAPANTAFRGVGVFPVPEPAHLSILGAVAMALYCRRRRR